MARREVHPSGTPLDWVRPTCRRVSEPVACHMAAFKTFHLGVAVSRIQVAC